MKKLLLICLVLTSMPVHSVTNEEILDRLDEMEWELIMRDNQRQLEQNMIDFDRQIERNKKTQKSQNFNPTPQKILNLRKIVLDTKHQFREIISNKGNSYFINQKSIITTKEGYKSFDVILLSTKEDKTSDGIKYNDLLKHLLVNCNNSTVNFESVIYVNSDNEIVNSYSETKWLKIEKKYIPLVKIQEYVCGK